MKTLTINRLTPQKISVQRGVALLITVVVLLVLTIAALAATNSNQTQSLMVRNNQFRLETFNTSYSEIDGQIDDINSGKISDGVPNYILAIFDDLPGASISSDVPTNTILLPIFTPAAKPSANEDYINQSSTLVYRGTCPTFGQPQGEGEETIKCSRLEIQSRAALADTDIDSDQSQIYEYRIIDR